MNGILVVSEGDDVSMIVVIDYLQPTRFLLYIHWENVFLPVIPLDIVAIKKLLQDVPNG